uniref:Serine/threonine-protein kinase TAO3 n=1 Tax=Davidia involucrata TaxID=16924 RepID=A0A5B7CAJ9_DAVIN
MGNCQVIDAAALVIQHPSGRIERTYWPVSVSEVMKMNPGHYVSLIIPLPISGQENTDDKTVRFTRVKLLRPSDTLVLGHAYRLITSQEVMKVLRAKKYAKMKKNQPESAEKLQGDAEKQSSSCQAEAGGSELEKTSQAMRQERLQQRPGSAKFTAARSKSWRSSLQSISEAGS